MEILVCTGFGKKRTALCGPLNFAGTKALCAYLQLPVLSATHIYPHILDIYKPASARVPVGVAHCISRAGPAATAITKFGHLKSPPV